MSSTDVEQSVKVIPFSGKRKDWAAWEEKFLARAKRKGFKDVLLGREEVPADIKEDGTPNEIAGETAEGKSLLKARERNELAYGELVLAMDTTKSAGKVAFSIACQTVEDQEISRRSRVGCVEGPMPQICPEDCALIGEASQGFLWGQA